MRVSKDEFHPGPNVMLVQYLEPLLRLTIIGSMPSIRISVTRSTISPVAISTGSIPSILVMLSFRKDSGVYLCISTVALSIRSDNKQPGLSHRTFFVFVTGALVSMSLTNFPHTVFFESSISSFFFFSIFSSNSIIAVNIEPMPSNIWVSIPISSDSLRIQFCRSFQPACNQLGFSSNRFRACDLIIVTTVCTSVLKAVLIDAPFATSASNVVVALKCSALAASKAA